MTRLLRFAAAVCLFATPVVLTGCTPLGSINCAGTAFISPTTATLDHALTGNSQQFNAGVTYATGCPAPAVVPKVTWSVSDPVNASITTTGVASCTNAATTAIVVNPGVAGFPTASLTCK